MSTLTDTSTAASVLSILIIDDDAVDVHWIERILLKDGGFDVRHAMNWAAGIAALQEREADLILLDLELPDCQGVGNVDQLMRHASVPIIVLTGLDDERVAIEAVGLGAQDYIVKGRFDEAGLLKSIRFATERHRLMRALD